jgi:hypothetical protein
VELPADIDRRCFARRPLIIGHIQPSPRPAIKDFSRLPQGHPVGDASARGRRPAQRSKIFHAYRKDTQSAGLDAVELPADIDRRCFARRPLIIGHIQPSPRPAIKDFSRLPQGHGRTPFTVIAACRRAAAQRFSRLPEGHGEPPVRFDEREVETEHGMRLLRHRRGNPDTELCRSLPHRATSRLYSALNASPGMLPQETLAVEILKV